MIDNGAAECRSMALLDQSSPLVRFRGHCREHTEDHFDIVGGENANAPGTYLLYLDVADRVVPNAGDMAGQRSELRYQENKQYFGASSGFTFGVTARISFGAEPVGGHHDGLYGSGLN